MCGCLITNEDITKINFHFAFFKTAQLPNHYSLTYQQKMQFDSNWENFQITIPQCFQNVSRWIQWKVQILGNNLDFYKKFYLKYSIAQSSYDRQIQKDLDRAFPQLQFFKNPQNRLKMAKILKSLVYYFPKVGYTQGMHFAIGLMLLISQGKQLQSFYFAVDLLKNPRFLLIGFFQNGFTVVRIYQFFFNKLFQKKLPKLYKKFQKIELANELWVFRCIMTGFISILPLEIVIRVWDFMISSNSLALIIVILCLLQQIQDQLLSLQNELSSYIIYLQELSNKNRFNQRINSITLFKRCKEMTLDYVFVQQLAFQYYRKQYNLYKNIFCNYTASNLQLNQIVEQIYQCPVLINIPNKIVISQKSIQIQDNFVNDNSEQLIKSQFSNPQEAISISIVSDVEKIENKSMIKFQENISKLSFQFQFINCDNIRKYGDFKKIKKNKSNVFEKLKKEKKIKQVPSLSKESKAISQIHQFIQEKQQDVDVQLFNL